MSRKVFSFKDDNRAMKDADELRPKLRSESYRRIDRTAALLENELYTSTVTTNLPNDKQFDRLIRELQNEDTQVAAKLFELDALLQKL